MKRSVKPMKKRGRKVNAWIKTRRQLSAEFLERGITSCELNLLPDCKRDTWLSFAHSLKRRFIKTDAELRECILCCTPCHDELDLKMTHEEMRLTVQGIIERRKQ